MAKNRLLVIDALLYTPQSALPFVNEELLPGKNTADLIIGQISKIDGIAAKVLLAPSYFPASELHKFKNASFDVIVSEPVSDMRQLLILVEETATRKNADSVALAWFDSPFLEPTISSSVIKLMDENECEYAFADNLPDGLAVECMSSFFLKDIVKSNPKRPELLSRKVFDNMDADINQYYVEVWLPEDDISLKRIEFHSQSKRNNALLKNFLASAGVVPDYKSIVSIVNEHPAVLYIYPRYLEIEITTESHNKPFYLPVSSRPKGFMSFPLFKKIVDEATAEYDDMIISLEGEGDPLHHKEIVRFVEYALKETRLQSLIIETNGVNLTDDMVASFTTFMPSKLQVIFKIDAAHEQTYSAIRGNAFSIMKTNIEKFIAASEQNRLRSFVQLTKLKENIDEMEDFFRFWEGKGVQVIIQKYNSYAGQLENRTVADLSPLDRMPCWHLQRDLHVFWDGNVPFCKQDFNARTLAGNLNVDSIQKIRDTVKTVYLANAKDKFDPYPLCNACDEWYTYNF